MADSLEIAITNEPLGPEHGEAEECVTAGRLTILAGDAYLSEGFSHYTQAQEKGPLVSGYYLAEWLAWNWWRHRWEPRCEDIEWYLAHHMGSFEGSYVWPNITIYFDGSGMVLDAKPSSRPDAIPFRYTQDLSVALPPSVWENAVDKFIRQIIDRLDAAGLKDTDVHGLHNDLQAERSDPELSRYCRTEAIAGRDPIIPEEGAPTSS